MSRRLLQRIGRTGVIGALLLMCAATSLSAGEVKESTTKSDDVQQLADRIDFHISNRWEVEGITPAPLSDDAEFLRRVYLHITGVIPPASEVRRFLADPSPDKRRRVVDELLESSGYVVNWTGYWRHVMMPEANADFQVRYMVPGFEAWLRGKLIENTAYDEMVEELLTTPLDGSRRNIYARAGEATPLAFYQAKQIKPENLAAGTSRIFLGVRIECAQCHDHPFDTWTREEFWSYAAFFAGIERQGNNNNNFIGRIQEVFDRRELTIPDTETVVQAAYLDGGKPTWKYRVGPRQTLANWMTSEKNPYFARSAVNRIWGHLFGRGIVDPVDDFGGGNDPSHPELLDKLAEEFVAHNYDVKHMIRGITASRTYQLTSRQTHESQEYPELFSRMSVQGLTADQIYRSLGRATGNYEAYQSRNPFAININSPQGEFLETFNDDSESPLDRQTTILQALAMMNGQQTANATQLQQSMTLAAIVDFPLMDTKGQIDALYLSTLSRLPTEQERERMVQYVIEGGPQKDSETALGDVFWALLNSSEFLLNH